MLSDHPITTVKNDLLGRAGFSRQVASAMLACPADKHGSITIGLCGGLGSGKTSVCNMVAEALEQSKGKKVAGKPPKPAPIVIRFNPWQYPAAGMIPEQFLKILADALRQPKHGEKLNKAAKAILQYAAALQRDGQPRNVLERKTKVCKRLRKQKRKIYIIIDDIDYLPAPRIREVLRLVDAVADFPRMVYLLSFDQQVVARALDAGGTESLKRFVQAQFTIPAPETGRIRDILILYLDTWRQSRPDLNTDPAYLDAVTPFLFACINSLRDMYRFANTFRFQYQALGDEVNFADLLMVTAMRLYAPKALPWVQAHRNDLLRGGGLAVRDASASCKQRMKREHQQMIAGLCESCGQTLEPTIARLFPRYGREVLGYEGEEPGERAVRMRRICCEEYFPLYFSLSTDGLAITHREILQSVRMEDVAALRQYTDGLTGYARRSAYINQLPYYLEDIPQDKLLVFFAETLWLSRLPEEASPAAERYQRSYFQACCYCALRMLARMEETMQSKSLQRAAARADVHTLPLLAVVLGRIRDHSPDADSVRIGDAAMAGYQEMALQAIRAFANGGNWLTQPRPLPVLAFWKQEDAETFAPYFAALKQDDCNLARLVSAVMLHFDQGESMEYQYGDMHGSHPFSDVFTRAEAMAALNRLRGTVAFAALPAQVQRDCVAFSLMRDGGNRVSQKAVLEAVAGWEP